MHVGWKKSKNKAPQEHLIRKMQSPKARFMKIFQDLFIKKKKKFEMYLRYSSPLRSLILCNACTGQAAPEHRKLYELISYTFLENISSLYN